MTYPAKLLLLGEYTILKGGKALAMPYSRYFGQWAFNPGGKVDIDLQGFFHFVRDREWPVKWELDRFEEELHKGLFFQSNIPMGYGLGSSGALVAGFFDRYYRGPAINDDAFLKELMADLEANFHGASSGTDPLICYRKQAYVLERNGPAQPVSLPTGNDDGPGALFLLDTGKSRQTQPLVREFNQFSKMGDFPEALQHALLPATQAAIEAFLRADWITLVDQVYRISDIQWGLFDKMILDELLPIWQNGDYALKLCGAGGGGFTLGITQDWETTQKRLKQYPLELVFRF